MILLVPRVIVDFSMVLIVDSFRWFLRVLDWPSRWFSGPLTGAGFSVVLHHSRLPLLVRLVLQFFLPTPLSQADTRTSTLNTLNFAPR